MRLEANEDEMYKRMDRRDLYRRFSVIYAAAGMILLVLVAAGYRSWQMIYLEAISVIGAVVLFTCYRNKDQYVMDMSNCFLELEEGTLTICQPLRVQEYETAKIDIREVEGIAAEKRKGRPVFYVMLKEGRDRRSVADGNTYRVIRVESFGYGCGEFWTLFLNFRDQVSKVVEVPPLKIPADKKWRKPQQFPFPALYLFLYTVPVIVPLLSYY
ncbi:hypothetical protein [Enterocloster bolteae]|uniref:hypothetical protein n=1 Tax=Enterocloster bolteae TaxID=208479 RepID=UPI0028DBBA85|nr:hypothetical protein [Enterocloster bolteae]